MANMLKVRDCLIVVLKNLNGSYSLHFNNVFSGEFPTRAAAMQTGKQWAKERK